MHIHVHAHTHYWVCWLGIKVTNINGPPFEWMFPHSSYWSEPQEHKTEDHSCCLCISPTTSVCAGTRRSTSGEKLVKFNFWATLAQIIRDKQIYSHYDMHQLDDTSLKAQRAFLFNWLRRPAPIPTSSKPPFTTATLRRHQPASPGRREKGRRASSSARR